MGMITVTTNGSFGNKQKVFKANKNGHADAVAQAIEWLSGTLLPESIAQDHQLHEEGEKPIDGFERKAL